MRAYRMWERLSNENPPMWRALRTRIRIRSTQVLPVSCLQQFAASFGHRAAGVDQEQTLKVKGCRPEKAVRF